ncbi:MAG: sporulation protein YqfD [Oscillospiraceae bacterium]|nr:sporulation protein YqfD [Oscillospiraceae bacterium]
MDFWNWLSGLIRIHITGADVAGSLSAISRAGITVFNGEVVDELNALITIRRKEHKKLQDILAAKGDSYETVKKEGLYWSLKQLLKRPVLTIGALVLLALNIYLPGRILFVQVEGNCAVPSRQILEAAEKCGLKFGANRRQIRSEKIKNALLEEIPQLQWSGVNTNGCVAVISVRERQITQEIQTEKVVSSIVASQDGVIYQCTVTRGNPVCKIGQAVKAGEVLISGYTDCGLTIQATKAEGEVYAKTERAVSLFFPRIWEKRMSNDKQITKYSLIIGKKRINLYNGSGISPTSCGKMYKETYMTLPGGFVLPVRVAEEIWIPCQVTDTQFDADEANTHLSGYAASYLSEQMIAGQVLSSKEDFSELEAVYQTEGKYACLEMIGKERKEEVYGKHE